MKRAFCLSCFILIFSFSFAQIAPIPIRWGKISKEEIEMKSYAADSTASAIVLYDICEVTFTFDFGEFKAEYEVLVRIKILNKFGFSHGEIEIPYTAKNHYDKFKDFKAHTINYDSNGLEKEIDVNKSLIFDKDLDGYMHSRNFTFPEIQVGSILEYRYTIQSDNKFELKKWFFQRDIPTAWSEYRTKIPEIFQYHVNIKGNNGMDVVQHETTLVDPAYRNYFLSNDNLNESRYVMKNVAGLRPEPYSYNTNSSFNSINLQLSNINLPMLGYHKFIKGWETFSEYLLDAEWFGKQFKNYSFLKNIKENLIEKKENKKEQITLIYNYIKNNYAFNEEYELQIDDLKKTHESKSGNGTEINSILLCLLREFEIEANPVVVCTRSNGQIDRSFPMLDQFDHMIVLIKIDTTNIFLDATDQLRPMTLIDPMLIGNSGYLIKDKSSNWVTLNKTSPVRVIKNYNLNISDNGAINGNYGYYSNSYEGIDFRNDVNKYGKEKLLNNLLSSNELNFKTDSIIYTIEDSLDNKVSMTSKLTSNLNVEDKFIYLTTLIYPDLHKNVFVSEKRYLPIEFDYPISEISTLNIIIPLGYKAEEIPKNEKVRLEDNSASFTLMSAVTGNNIVLRGTFTINKLHFEAVEYKELQDFFSNVSKMLSQQIVLSKI